MYRYTECPQCSRETLLSTEPDPGDPNAFLGRCLHCGAVFTFRPVKTETPPSADKNR
jgi:hypothetical protein